MSPSNPHFFREFDSITSKKIKSPKEMKKRSMVYILASWEYAMLKGENVINPAMIMPTERQNNFLNKSNTGIAAIPKMAGTILQTVFAVSKQ